MPSQKEVVLVDDDEDLLRILVYCFQTEGFQTRSFTLGKEAKDYLLDEKNIGSVVLVVLDRLLPDMDGIEILEQFQQKYKGRVPVLILSILDSDKDILHGLKKGAVDYVAKPFNQTILLEKARHLIERNPNV